MMAIHIGEHDAADFDPAQLDPGIRRLVCLLRAAGFRTTDSGDGSAKFGTDQEGCAESAPNVYMVVDPDAMIAESRRLAEVLRAVCSDGLLDETQDVDGMDVPRVFVDANYNPLDDIAILAVHGVGDADLKVPT